MMVSSGERTLIREIKGVSLNAEDCGRAEGRDGDERLKFRDEEVVSCSIGRRRRGTGGHRRGDERS